MILKKINGTLIRKCKVNDQYRIFAPIPMARTTAAQAAASKTHHQSPCHTQNRAHSSKIDHIVAKLIPLAAPISLCGPGQRSSKINSFVCSYRPLGGQRMLVGEGGDATARLVFWSSGAGGGAGGSGGRGRDSAAGLLGPAPGSGHASPEQEGMARTSSSSRRTAAGRKESVPGNNLHRGAGWTTPWTPGSSGRCCRRWMAGRSFYMWESRGRN